MIFPSSKGYKSMSELLDEFQCIEWKTKQVHEIKQLLFMKERWKKWNWLWRNDLFRETLKGG